MTQNHYQQIERIEAKENAGSYGAWRREYCKKYRETLVLARNNSYKSLVDNLSSKKKITCRKGCTYCCFHYVAVPLAHAIVIVDHLYRKKELLEKFIHNYEKWSYKAYIISDKIDYTRVRAFSSSMPINDIIAVTRPLSMRYLEMDIPCPFLANDSCLIYDVRPWPCSGQYSISPPEWCNHATANNAVIHQLIPADEDLLKFLKLADPKLMIYEVTLPIMIFKLLTEGASSIISNMTDPKPIE